MFPAVGVTRRRVPLVVHSTFQWQCIPRPMATNDAIGEQNEMKLDIVCSVDVWSHLDLNYSFEVLTERARELKILRTSLQKKSFLCWASRYVGRTQNKERGSQPTAPVSRPPRSSYHYL